MREQHYVDQTNDKGKYKTIRERMILSIIVLIGLMYRMFKCRSHIGGLGATTSTVACVSMGIDNPYVVAMCTLGGVLQCRNDVSIRL